MSSERRHRTRVTGLWRRIRETFLPDTRPASPRPSIPRLPSLPKDDLHLQKLGLEFSRELLSKLLAALPKYRDEITEAYHRGDLSGVRNSVHQVLGAAAYCKCGTLEDDLRNLRRALKTDDPYTINVYYARLITTMDTLARFSGNDVLRRY